MKKKRQRLQIARTRKLARYREPCNRALFKVQKEPRQNINQRAAEAHHPQHYPNVNARGSARDEETAAVVQATLVHSQQSLAGECEA